MGVRFIPETCLDKDTTGLNYGWSFVFFLVSIWLFVGIAMASNIFMNAIEKITSSTRMVHETNEENGVKVSTTKEVPIWNSSVANLALALGSSISEILLSVIETISGLGQNEPGELGPGTIVGSAAFNMLVINCWCIVCLKEEQKRKVRIYKVYIIANCVSLFAYLWMVIVLEWVTPDEIEIWESLFTLAFYPLLVLLSYWADQDFCVDGKKPRRGSVASTESIRGNRKSSFLLGSNHENLYDSDGNVQKEALQHLYLKLTEVAILTPDEIVTVLATKLVQSKHHSRFWYRTKSIKALFGKGKGLLHLDAKLQEVVDVIGEEYPIREIHDPYNQPLTKPTTDAYTKKAVVEFQAAALAVAENIGTFHVTLRRKGKEDVAFQVQVTSFDGTAVEGLQYEPISEVIKFDPYEKEHAVAVHIFDNFVWNPDTYFYLKLTVLQEEKAMVGQMRIIEIIIEDNEKPGKLSFTNRAYVFSDTSNVGYVEVERTDGSDGLISVTWKITPGPNRKHLSLARTGGVLEFGPGEKKKYIEIQYATNTGLVKEMDEVFDLELLDPQGGAQLGSIIVTTCAITSDEGFKLEIINIIKAAILKSKEDEDGISYKQQIINSVFPNEGNWKKATWLQWTIHLIIFPFKVMLCLIPPPNLKGGYPCFMLALFAVGVLTKFVDDSAGNFGKCVGLDPMITAVTVVAVGTSLPNAFASLFAAKNDKTADNALGNVTGSNSVNVFVGLGLPWTVGSIYYSATKSRFCVDAGTLSFNVLIFSLCGLITIAIFTLRRFSSLCGNAELGGPRITQWISFGFMIALWIWYIGMTVYEVLHAEAIIRIFGDQSESICHRILDHAKKNKS